MAWSQLDLYPLGAVPWNRDRLDPYDKGLHSYRIFSRAVPKMVENYICLSSHLIGLGVVQGMGFVHLCRCNTRACRPAWHNYWRKQLVRSRSADFTDNCPVGASSSGYPAADEVGGDEAEEKTDNICDGYNRIMAACHNNGD